MTRRPVGALLGLVLAASAATPLSAATYSGTKWGSPVFGTGATVTWSFMGRGVCCDPAWGSDFFALADFMPPGFDTAIRAAFNAWSAVADIVFVEVADGGEDFDAPVGLSDIRIGGRWGDGPRGTLAYGYFPPPNGFSGAGDIHFDVEETWQIGFDGKGYDIFRVVSHEIGHALGLDHSSDRGALMHRFYSRNATNGPQADDILGIQALYGKRPAPTGPVPAGSSGSQGGSLTAAVPLPASLALLSGALALFATLGRRRRA